MRRCCIRPGSASSSLASSSRSGVSLRRETQKWRRSAATQRFSYVCTWEIAREIARVRGERR